MIAQALESRSRKLVLERHAFAAEPLAQLGRQGPGTRSPAPAALRS